MPLDRTAPALRPFLPADTPILAAIFVASIEELTADDYSEAQRAAWAAVAPLTMVAWTRVPPT